MDGGRVLRAWLAGRMPLHKATRIAADIGKGFAIIFGIIGLFFSPFLILIALLSISVRTWSPRPSNTATCCRTSRSGHDEQPGDHRSAGHAVRQVIEMMYTSKHLGFPVVERDTLIGMITLRT